MNSTLALNLHQIVMKSLLKSLGKVFKIFPWKSTMFTFQMMTNIL